jgi:hypothetical protein
MSVRFVNNFSAPLAAGIDSAETTLSFAAGVGDSFRDKLGTALGTDHVYMTLYNAGGDIEYVKVTATSGDDFTVVRGQDNSTARAWLSGDRMACRPNAAALQEAVSLPTNLAHSGINIDITEIRGLEVPLSAGQGGTGVTTGLNSLPSGATGVTPTAGDSTTKLATTAFVTPAISAAISAAAATTTAEIAAAVDDLPVLTPLTAQTASGSSIDFSIPAGTKRITIALAAVHVAGMYVALGDSGGIEASGYVGTYGFGTHFRLASDSSSYGATGVITLVNLTGNTWCLGGNVVFDSAPAHASAGYKALSGALTTVRVGAAFGSLGGGNVNVLYE